VKEKPKADRLASMGRGNKNLSRRRKIFWGAWVPEKKGSPKKKQRKSARLRACSLLIQERGKGKKKRAHRRETRYEEPQLKKKVQARGKGGSAGAYRKTVFTHLGSRATMQKWGAVRKFKPLGGKKKQSRLFRKRRKGRRGVIGSSLSTQIKRRETASQENHKGPERR